MKRTFKRFSIVLIVVLTMASTVFSQITVQVYIENAQVNSGTYSWEIHFKPLSGWIEDGGGESYLAEASYYFNYNNAALSNPVITYSNPLCDGSHYTSTTGITAGKVYVSQVAKFNSESQFIQGTKYHMYTVEMDITDNSATSGLDWDHLNNTGIENAAGDVADANDITFSGSGDISLPVNLSAFSALCTLNGIKLKWTSESEIDNLGYILEKKLGDTVQWQTIASYKTHPELIGQGNSSSYANYTFTDINISTGDVYTYRLSDVNTKGEQTVLGTTKVTVTQDILPKVTGLLPAWPNPFNPVTSIKYQLSSSEQVNLKILDIMGRTVKSLVQDKQQQAGSYTLTWSGKDARDIKVSSGVYFVLLRAGKFTKYQKVLLVR